jgi:hypothetical protein
MFDQARAAVTVVSPTIGGTLRLSESKIESKIEKLF